MVAMDRQSRLNELASLNVIGFIPFSLNVAETAGEIQPSRGSSTPKLAAAFKMSPKTKFTAPSLVELDDLKNGSQVRTLADAGG